MLIKHYPQDRICDEFYQVIDFLKTHGAKGYNKNWHWARWEWLIGHSGLDEATLPKIGLLMDDDKVVGLATHDMSKPAYVLLNPQYQHLKPEMIDYAYNNLSQDGASALFVDESDAELISAAKLKGYSPTTEREFTLKLDCTAKLTYSLDDKFAITDYHESKDIDKYVAVIHKGFNNAGEPRIGLTEADFPKQPHQDPKLTVFIAAPGGEYAAHCGAWYSPHTESCYIEPVVTIPEFAGQGLGRAAVYEAINRCAALGAKKAIVISNQQFYHHIGFKQYSVCSLWRR